MMMSTDDIYNKLTNITKGLVQHFYAWFGLFLCVWYMMMA